MSEQQPKKWWLETGVLLAIIPALIYGLTFLYEVGYTSEFEVPMTFITVTTTNFFTMAATSLLVVTALLLTFELFSRFIPSQDDALRRRLLESRFLILYFITFTVMFPRDHLWIWVVLWGFAALLAFDKFLVPLWTQRGKGSYREKLAAAEKPYKEQIVLLDMINKRFGHGGAQLLAILFIIGLFTFEMGRSAALKQQDFLVWHDPPDSVVLRIYGDNVVYALFDEKTKTIQPNFFILKLDSQNKRIWNLERVGPLRPVK